MSESETKPASPIPTVTCAQCCGGLATSQCPTLQVTSRMLRSPSHESVTTDLSLFSVSSIASELRGANRLVTFKSYSDVQLTGRGPSPKPDSARQIQGNRPADIPEILWFEEENELIRSCGVLSSALGLRKSFSTSDVSQLPSPDASGPGGGLRTAVSALALDTAQRNTLLLEHARLDHASRSCSTWVAVGEPVASTSQLPSPHGGAAQEQQPQQLLQQPQQSSSSSVQPIAQQPPPQPPAPPPPPVPFTGADLVRSVNKKVRQNYIRRRLLTTYRALERLSQSEFNLDQLEAAATAAQTSHGTTLLVPGTAAGVPGASLIGRKERNHALTVRDVERERGNQLSKYERNMMIFNWLHTLDDSAVVDSVE
ncbi:PREDICTED: uncharacterized protein LOC106746713 [Dinoponera quadriceps]|uniref:Uncharacterized protein LOC106746713 n=1 Tax=Dinoponera quadriceps TaxID=609295 RepID=A0A6P3XKX2_DINQU|nr:PREDICTED: uncharacterized protein LOC106746713 [Dinoponera quadriceps]XP_014479043.1 PREDICTED: uncharacterized protein LOC106746713 [Dinoponera quadriceps]XP_014479044.1 PREDICTED: uncharacterized protein LOC106746713 [Dinoponera quadriceps]XP_014479045.1 PREDICTED: uncharacterized protein LOC106746713 [Dinoponera quadriceps]XP_014479046.1 PREDICTED: uncharacterized protein LOC106746713 [Dinoponera quadriceps]XP_014479048.1 PREDICTED: uncharacterized protein LOC106746713 [Dinoponera quadr